MKPMRTNGRSVPNFGPEEQADFTQFSGTWAWEGASEPAELNQVMHALHQVPGVENVELTYDRLEVEYDPELFQERNLVAVLDRAGSYRIVSRLATTLRREPPIERRRQSGR